MSTVIIDISVSLDGYITAARQSAAEPLGVGGLRLHAWGYPGDADDQALIARTFPVIGAYISGRRCYDHSLPWWHADGPTGAERTPVVVVTHTPPASADVPANSVYTFVPDIESALATARELAGERDIRIMGGANLIDQYLRAGMADELLLHVVPVLFGGGQRLFNALPDDTHTNLETLEVVPTANAVHLRFRVLGPITPTPEAAS